MLTLSIIQESENKTDDTRGYRWTARINYKEIASGKVRGSRKDGWEALVQQILDERNDTECNRNCSYKVFHEQNYPKCP